MNELVTLLNEQQQLLTQLLNIISDEKAALIAQDSTALMALAEQKSAALFTLQQQDNALSQHPSRELLNTDPTLKDLVANARVTLEECKTLNSLNAQLIEHHQASLNRLAQALQMSRNASSLTYTNKGRTSTLASLGNRIEV